MTDPTDDELRQLAADVSRIISDNRKFLTRLLDDDFEPEEEDGEEPADTETPVG